MDQRTKLCKLNGRDARLDLREWAPGRDRMGKGITLSTDEAIKLRDILIDMNLG